MGERAEHRGHVGHRPRRGDLAGRGAHPRFRRRRGAAAPRRARRALRHQQRVAHRRPSSDSAWPRRASTPSADDLVTSAQAAASMLGARVDGGGVRGRGRARGARRRGASRCVPEGPADAVVVGWTRRFDFDLLATAATAVRLGARFVGTNEDPTHPTPDAPAPGIGRDPGRGGHRRPGHPRGGRQAPRPVRRPAAGASPRRRARGGGPALHRRRAGPAARGCPSRWCGPG